MKTQTIVNILNERLPAALPLALTVGSRGDLITVSVTLPLAPGDDRRTRLATFYETLPAEMQHALEDAAVDPLLAPELEPAGYGTLIQSAGGASVTLRFTYRHRQRRIG